MKKLFYLMLAISCCTTMSAQSNVCEQEEADTMLSDNVNNVLKAWIALNEAVTNSDNAAIANAAESMRECRTCDFSTLKYDEKSMPSLNGHLIYDEDFADSLVAGSSTSDNADKFNTDRTTRGQTSDGSVLTKTVVVKRGKSIKCRFNAKGRQELCAAAEAGGLITMKISVTNSAGLNKRYDDTKDVKKGRNFRKAVFEMPKEMRNVVTVEIVNCSDKDISVVIISN